MRLFGNPTITSETPEPALATVTAGMSVIFHHADVVAGLVKQFHKDVLGK
jgi:hypothetical protein